MSLINHPKSSDNTTAARRRNGRKSRGATTPQGKERIRAANLKHGYYSKVREEALVSLGEDPKDLAALIAGAHEQFEPANAYQADLVTHLAGLRWRMRRAERMQESAMVENIQALESRRHHAALQVRYRYADISGFLTVMRQAVGRPDYHTHPCFIQRCTELIAHEPTQEMQAILEMLLMLRKPQQFAAELPPPRADAMIDSDWETVEDTYYEGAASAHPHPEIAVAEGGEREPLREELRALIDIEIRQSNDSWGKAIAKAEAPLSIVERDGLAREVHKENILMRREESTCFREFWRLSTILGKTQKEADGRSQEPGGRRQESEVPRPMSEVGIRNSEIASSSEVVSSLSELATPGEVPASDFGPRTSDSAPPPSNSELRTSNSAIPTPDSSLLSPSLKNEGDSGDVDENKGSAKQVSEVWDQASGSTPNGFRAENAPESPLPASVATHRAA